MARIEQQTDQTCKGGARLGLALLVRPRLPLQLYLGFEVERAEDDGSAEIEWLPFQLRPAPKELPKPRGTYIRDHQRDHVYGLAATHEIEIHVPRCPLRSRLALTLHWFAEEKGRGRAYRDAAHRVFFVEGLNLADERVLREAAQEASLGANEAIVAAWDPQRISDLRAMREEAKSIGIKGVPTVATAERILYYGAASPGKFRALLTSQRDIAS